jgi:hypothetical protein
MTADTIGAPTAVLADSARYEFAVGRDLNKLRLLVFITSLSGNSESFCGVTGRITINGVDYADLGWGLSDVSTFSAANVVQDHSWDTFVPKGATVGVTIATFAGQVAAACKVQIIIIGGAQLTPVGPIDGPSLWYKGDIGLVEDAGLAVSIADQSGFGEDAVSNTLLAAAPAVVPNAIGGITGLQFPDFIAGPVTAMFNGPFNVAYPLTLFCVFKPTTNNGGVLLMLSTGGGVSGALAWMVDTLQYVNPYAVSVPIDHRAGLPTVLVMTISAGGAVKVWINGSPRATTGTAAPLFGPGLTLGAMNNSGSLSRSAGAVVTEWEIWPVEFDDSQAAQQYAYAVERYGL